MAKSCKSTKERVEKREEKKEDESLRKCLAKRNAVFEVQVLKERKRRRYKKREI
jgi:hypothetical protein